MSDSPDRYARLRFAYLEEPPFCFTDADGAVGGCDVELARMAVHRAGCGSFEPVVAKFADLLPGLVAGRWDMTTGLFVTEERERSVAFSTPVWALPDGLLIRADDQETISGYASITASGTKTLAVIAAQAQHRTALRIGIAPSSIRVFRTQDEAAGAVVSGSVDAYASVAMAHRGWIARNQGAAVVVAEVAADEQAPGPGAFAFRKEDLRVRDAIDAALDGILGTPEHLALMEGYGFSAQDVRRAAGAQPRA